MILENISSDWPAWIQAIGSLVALIFAIAIPAIQRKNELADRALERKEAREKEEAKAREEEAKRRKRACDLAMRLVPEINQAARYAIDGVDFWESTSTYVNSIEPSQRPKAFREAAASATFPLGLHLQQWVIEHADIESDEGGMLLRQLGITHGLYTRELQLLILRAESINDFTNSCALMKKYCNQFAVDAELSVRLLKIKHDLIDVDVKEFHELQRSSVSLAELEAKLKNNSKI